MSQWRHFPPFQQISIALGSMHISGHLPRNLPVASELVAVLRIKIRLARRPLRHILWLNSASRRFRRSSHAWQEQHNSICSRPSHFSILSTRLVWPACSMCPDGCEQSCVFSGADLCWLHAQRRVLYCLHASRDWVHLCLPPLRGTTDRIRFLRNMSLYHPTSVANRKQSAFE